LKYRREKTQAIVASDAARRARSDVSYTNNKRHHRHGSRFENLEYLERQRLSKNLDSSFLLVDEQGNIIPKTPKEALVGSFYQSRLNNPNIFRIETVKQGYDI
jgi:hypothetical protein